MRLLGRLSWFALALAAAHVLVGMAMTFAGNTEGPFGGVLYAAFYAIPLLLIALALRSVRQGWHTTAGWAALVLAVFYVAVVLGNRSGYSTQAATFAVMVTVPTAVLDLAIFWAGILRRPRRSKTSTPAA
jgi:hypothetical protein